MTRFPFRTRVAVCFLAFAGLGALTASRAQAQHGFHGDGFHGGGHGHHGPSFGHQHGGAYEFGRALGNMFHSLNQHQHQHQHHPHYHQHRSHYHQPQYMAQPTPRYYRVPSQPQPQYQPPPPRPQPAAKVVKNSKPPEKINANRDNKCPTDQGIDPVDSATRSLASQVVKQEGKEKLNGLKSKLGDAANDPAVAEQLKNIETKFANNQAVTDQEINDLVTAVNASGKLDPSVSSADLNTLVTGVQGLSEANKMLSQSLPLDPSAIPSFPTGPTKIVMMPGLPEDDMVMLPCGGIMMGTGGSGCICVSTVDGAELLDFPLGVGEPVADSDDNVAKRVKDGTLLLNPSENDATVNYVIANKNYSMDAGNSQRLSAGRKWVIRFDRGQDFGEARYTLADGTYVFVSSDRGWELRTQKFSVTIDNSESEEPFYYNVDNTQVKAAAGGTKTHSSPYPILVRFDRGGGGEAAQKKILEKDERILVAVNPDDGLWDLYPAEADTQVAEKPSPQRKISKKQSKRTARLRELLELSSK